VGLGGRPCMYAWSAVVSQRSVRDAALVPPSRCSTSTGTAVRSRSSAPGPEGEVSVGHGGGDLAVLEAALGHAGHLVADDPHCQRGVTRIHGGAEVGGNHIL